MKRGCGLNTARQLRSFAFDHTLGNTPYPVPNCAAKPQWARLVLGWGTTRESRGVECVFLAFESSFLIF